MSIIRRFDDYVRRVRAYYFSTAMKESTWSLVMTHLAVKCSKMEIQAATNRRNYYEDNGLMKGWGCAVGKINQTTESLVGFRYDGSRVHDLWTLRYFRPKIHYILHLARRSVASES